MKNQTTPGLEAVCLRVGTWCGRCGYRRCELAATPKKTTPGLSEREEIARVIEPELWRWADEGKRPQTSQRIQDSLAKADAILALLAARKEAAGGEGSLREALTDLCDAWDYRPGHHDGGKYRGNITNAQRAARAMLSAAPTPPLDRVRGEDA